MMLFTRLSKGGKTLQSTGWHIPPSWRIIWASLMLTLRIKVREFCWCSCGAGGETKTTTHMSIFWWSQDNTYWVSNTTIASLESVVLCTALLTFEFCLLLRDMHTYSYRSTVSSTHGSILEPEELQGMLAELLGYFIAAGLLKCADRKHTKPRPGKKKLSKWPSRLCTVQVHIHVFDSREIGSYQFVKIVSYASKIYCTHIHYFVHC